MAEYTETWKEWQREHDRILCTCPICHDVKDYYCSDECCEECADYEQHRLERLMLLIPPYAREILKARILEDDAEFLNEWALDDTEAKKQNVIMWLYSNASKREREAVKAAILEV